jgi:MFS family permease
MIIPFLLSGSGLSLAIPATQSCVLNSVEKHQVGKASGVFNMLRQMGAVFGVAVLVLVFSANGSYKSAQDFNNGFAMALYAAATLSFLGAISGYCLPNSNLQIQPAKIENKTGLQASRNNHLFISMIFERLQNRR